jgi:hypothetical protein
VTWHPAHPTTIADECARRMAIRLRRAVVAQLAHTPHRSSTVHLVPATRTSAASGTGRGIQQR